LDPPATGCCRHRRVRPLWRIGLEALRRKSHTGPAVSRSKTKAPEWPATLRRVLQCRNRFPPRQLGLALRPSRDARSAAGRRPNAASRACTTRLRSMPSHVSQSNASTAVALRPTLIGGSACSASSVRSRSSSAGSAGSANVNGARALHHHPGRTYVRVKRDHDRTQSGHRPAPRAREPTLATPQPGHADAPSGCVSRLVGVDL
jgi:hypothetical protein